MAVIPEKERLKTVDVGDPTVPSIKKIFPVDIFYVKKIESFKNKK